MLKIAILGCGRIGRVHALSLSRAPGARLAAVADAMPDAARDLAAQYDTKARDTDAILTDPGIDAIVIATPTDTHFDLIHTAAAQSKAIFCEKPVDLDADRILACQRAVTAAGIPFMTAFNRRFDPNFADLRARLVQGEIGDAEIVTILSRDPAPPPISYIESSGGLFRDMMIHDFDMARFLLEDEPVTIHATGSALVDPAIGAAGDVDTAAVMLTTASGRIAQISCSRRASYGYDQRIELHGSRGMLRADNVHETTVESAGPDGFRRAPVRHFFLERYEAAYQAEMAAFIDALTSGKAPTPSLIDGLRAQRLADAATESWREGRVVTLSG